MNKKLITSLTVVSSLFVGSHSSFASQSVNDTFKVPDTFEQFV